MNNSNLTTFTTAQATHADQVLCDLMKNKRWFLTLSTAQDEDAPLFPINSQVCPATFTLNRSMRDDHKALRLRSDAQTRRIDKKNGVREAKRTKDQTLTQCPLLRGKVDTVSIFPLGGFTEFVPESLEVLIEKLREIELRFLNVGELSPNSMDRINDEVHARAETTWAEFQELIAANAFQERVVALLQARSHLSRYGINGDLFDGELNGII